jgi:ATP-binding protein involved in chromosome partitioning
LQVPVLGVVENMAGFVCPCCEEVTDIFSRGGGEALAAARGAPFLGRLPLDPRVASCMDAGVPLATVCTDAEPRAGRRASAAAS